MPKRVERSHATSQNMHEYGSNTDALFWQILHLRCERYGIFSDFCHHTTSNESLKYRFWKETPVENVFTLERLPFYSIIDNVSYLTLQKRDIPCKQCHMLISPYIVTFHTWANGTGHTSVTYFCLWLLH